MYKGIAIGEMGMSVAEFEKMLIGDFFLKLRYFYKSQEEKFKAHANLTRFQTWMLVNIQLGKEDKIKTPEELWQFKWEEDESNVELEKIDKKEVIEGVKRLSNLL